MIRNIIFCLLILAISSHFNVIISQEVNVDIARDIPKVISIKLDIVHFYDGKKIKIEGLTDPQKQVVFIVNHVQTDSIGLDPGLTYDGNKRASQLMRLLKKTNIANIYSILFRRTVLTARPLVKELHIPIKHFDPGQIDYLTETYFKANNRNSLVVGTPSAVKDLLNEISSSIDYTIAESHPYQFIYIVEMDKIKPPVIHRFRY